MSDLISRQAVLSSPLILVHDGMKWIPVYYVKELPSAQKIGKWIPWKAYYGQDHKSWTDELKCSECGYKWGDEEYNFCPMCGTKMEVQDD